MNERLWIIKLLPPSRLRDLRRKDVGKTVRAGEKEKARGNSFFQTQTGPMHIGAHRTMTAHTSPAQVHTRQNPTRRRDNGHKAPPLTKEPFAIDNLLGKRISFLQWKYINHTLWQACCPRVAV